MGRTDDWKGGQQVKHVMSAISDIPPSGSISTLCFGKSIFHLSCPDNTL
jgi:hypothetical protein